MRSSEHSKAPMRREVGVDDDRGDVVGGEVAEVALDPDVLEALGAVAGLEHVAVDRRREITTSVWNGRSTVDLRSSRAMRCSWVTSPSWSSHSP